MSGTLTDLLAPAWPERRVAILRRVIAAFVAVDVLWFSGDVRGHAASAEFYRPTLLARLLHLPPVTSGTALALLAVVLATAACGVAGIRPRLTGAVMGAAFWIWMLYSQGYGYVRHDHLALMVAVAVLPTAGPCPARSPGRSRRAGWALRCIQLAVVLTYAYSVLSKTVISGSPWAWANSAVFAFAIIRRGTPWAHLLLQVPWLLVPAQWGVILMETLSPLALFLRGRALYLMVGLYLTFHLVTLLLLGIHFLPTVVCWAAFLPLERWGRHARRTPENPSATTRAGAGAAAQEARAAAA